MDHFCASHPEEKAVGICARCGHPACYRCSLNVDQVVYCSLQCFNELDPPSAPNVPSTWTLAIDPLSGVDLNSKELPPRTGSSVLFTGSDGPGPVSDLYVDSKSTEAKPPPAPGLESEPSVILGAHEADEPHSEPSVILSAHHSDGDHSNTTILGMTPVQKSASPAESLLDETASALASPLADETVSAAFDPGTPFLVRPPSRDAEGEGPMLLVIPGTRRSMISSSCFFHPDTSAIVLCAECRNPICSLCAAETTAGLVCSPSCGVPDPVRDQQIRKFKLSAYVIAAAFVAVFSGAAFIFHSYRQEEFQLTRPLSERHTPEAPASMTPPLEPKTVELPKPEPLPAPVANVDPPKVEPAKAEPARPELPKVTAKVEAPEPVPPKVEAPKPAPLKVDAPKPTPPRPTPPTPAPTALELDLKAAGLMMREAEPVFRELAEAMDPKLLPKADIQALWEKFDQLSVLLSQAQGLYFRRLGESPDRALFEKRIQMLGELLEAVDEGQARILVPRTILEADRHFREATPIYHEIIFRLKSPLPDEAARVALQGMAEAAEAKFREARSLYIRVKPDAPDPRIITQRIRTIDGFLQKLESRLTDVRAPAK